MVARAATRVADCGVENTASLVALSRVGPHASMDAQLAPPPGMPQGICPDDPSHDDGGATGAIR